MRTIALLTISNIFMTFAWYGHLKYREVPLYKVIVVSWLIAFFEYCFQVPANRIGSFEFSAAQLKTIQESHHTARVLCIFGVLPEAARALEPRRGIRDDRGRGGSNLQTVVTEKCSVLSLPILPNFLIHRHRHTVFVDPSHGSFPLSPRVRALCPNNSLRFPQRFPP